LQPSVKKSALTKPESAIYIQTLEDVIEETSRFTYPDIKKISKLITPEYVRNLQSGISKKLVMVMGPTKAGKSTLINYLSGCLYDSNTRRAVFISGSGKEIAKVGRKTFVSETQLPAVYELDCTQEFAFCDCPGFYDNRTDAERIVASLGTEMLVKYSGNCVAIVLVIEASSIMGGSAKGFNQVAGTLSRLLKHRNLSGVSKTTTSTSKTSEKEEQKSSIIFVITKTGKGFTHEELFGYIQKLHDTAKEKIEMLIKKQSCSKTDQEQLEQYGYLLPFLKLMLALPENVIIEDPRDFSSQEIILNCIRRAKEIPKEAFDFQNYDPRRQEFNELLNKMIANRLSYLNRAMELLKSIKEDRSTIERYQEEIQQLEKAKLDENRTNNLKQMEELRQEIDRPDVPDLEFEESTYILPIEEGKVGIRRAIDYCKKLQESLDSDEEILHQVKTVRQSYRFWRSKMDEKLEYKGIPFTTARTFVDGGGFHCLVEQGQKFVVDGSTVFRGISESIVHHIEMEDRANIIFSTIQNKPEQGIYETKCHVPFEPGVASVAAPIGSVWLGLGFFGPIGWAIGGGIAALSALSGLVFAVTGEEVSAGVKIYIAKRDEPKNAANLKLVNQDLVRLQRILDEKEKAYEGYKQGNERIENLLKELSTLCESDEVQLAKIQASNKQRQQELRENIRNLQSGIQTKENELILLGSELDYNQDLFLMLIYLDELLGLNFNLASRYREYQAAFQARGSQSKEPVSQLHLAASEGDMDTIEGLAKEGGFHRIVDIQCNLGRTPLHEAVIIGQLEVVERLVELGADFFITDNDGKTPRDLAIANRQSDINIFLQLEENKMKASMQQMQRSIEESESRRKEAEETLKRQQSALRTELSVPMSYLTDQREYRIKIIESAIAQRDIPRLEKLLSALPDLRGINLSEAVEQGGDEETFDTEQQVELRSKGAILSLEHLIEDIENNLSNIEQHPENQPILKKLYHLLERYIKNWQEGTLQSVVVSEDFDQAATAALIEKYYTGTLKETVREVLNQELQKDKETNQKLWLLDQVPAATKELFDAKMEGHYLHRLRDWIPENIPGYDQIQANIQRAFYARYRENRLEESYAKDIDNTVVMEILEKLTSQNPNIKPLTPEFGQALVAEATEVEATDEFKGKVFIDRTPIYKAAIVSLLKKWRDESLEQETTQKAYAEFEGMIESRLAAIRLENPLRESLEREGINILIAQVKIGYQVRQGGHQYQELPDELLDILLENTSQAIGSVKPKPEEITQSLRKLLTIKREDPERLTEEDHTHIDHITQERWNHYLTKLRPYVYPSLMQGQVQKLTEENQELREQLVQMQIVMTRILGQLPQLSSDQREASATEEQPDPTAQARSGAGIFR
jgi:GTP-binding protein EngB required for normal cell division